MKKTVLLVLTIILASHSLPLDAANWTVYLRRVGALRIGMSMPDVRRVLGDPKASLSGTGPEPDTAECAYLKSSAVPGDLGVMFQKGQLVRIEVRKAGIKTASGVGVGDTEEKIKAVYRGRVTVEPHKYEAESGAHYVNYRPADPADRDYGMVFETAKGRVTRFRTGTLAAVSLVEGCA